MRGIYPKLYKRAIMITIYPITKTSLSEAMTAGMETDFEQIIEIVAEEQGITPDEVKRSIQEALEAGRNNPAPAVQAMWRSIPRKGEEPTLNEVLTFLVKKTAEQNYH